MTLLKLYKRMRMETFTESMNLLKLYKTNTYLKIVDFNRYMKIVNNNELSEGTKLDLMKIELKYLNGKTKND